MRTKSPVRVATVIVTMATFGAAATMAVTSMAGTTQRSLSESGSIDGLPSFAGVVERVSPAVVNISVTKRSLARAEARQPRAMPGSPLEEFFGRYFEHPRTPRGETPSKGVGSGFILDGEGYVVTGIIYLRGQQVPNQL